MSIHQKAQEDLRKLRRKKPTLTAAPNACFTSN